MLHYRFYFLDMDSKIAAHADVEHPDDTSASLAAKKALLESSHAAIEIWQSGRMVYRTGKDTVKH